MLTIILPTYNEKENLKRLIPLIHKTFMNEPYRIIVVDDNSPDGTADVAKKFAQRGYPVRVYVRKDKAGLASATLLGLKKARTKYVAVMDADMQHSPKDLYKMYKLIKQRPELDIVIGSRYVNGADFSNWPLWRKLISFSALMIYRFFAKAKDPLSQFYVLRKSMFDFSKLEGRGNRLSLELLLRFEPRFVEYPIKFGTRRYGQSKILTLGSIVTELVTVYRMFNYKLNNLFFGRSSVKKAAAEITAK